MRSRMYVSSPFIDDILIMTVFRTQRMGEYPVDVTPTYKGRADGSTMKALVWMGTKQVELIDAPVPDVTEPDDVIVKVTGTTICGSDLHLYHGEILPLQKGDMLGHEVRVPIPDMSLHQSKIFYVVHGRG